MDPSIPGEIYVPSDDDMSDILHNAGHAYRMYLHSDDEKDDNTMSLEDTSVFTLLYILNEEIIYRHELAYLCISLSSPQHDLHIYHSICVYDL